MTAATLSTPDIAEVITTAIHVWMFEKARHPDIGVHVALTLADTYRITPRHKTRRPAA